MYLYIAILRLIKQLKYKSRLNLCYQNLILLVLNVYLRVFFFKSVFPVNFCNSIVGSPNNSISELAKAFKMNFVSTKRLIGST